MKTRIQDIMVNDPTEKMCLTEMGLGGHGEGSEKLKSKLSALADSEKTKEFQVDTEQVVRASLVAQLVKNPPLMWETWVRPLAWEYSLEKGKATQPIPVFWPRELFHGLYSSWGHKESDTTK